jgi:hypothetical protein
MINVQRIHDEHDAFADKGLADVANALAEDST